MERAATAPGGRAGLGVRAVERRRAESHTRMCAIARQAVGRNRHGTGKPAPSLSSRTVARYGAFFAPQHSGGR